MKKQMTELTFKDNSKKTIIISLIIGLMIASVLFSFLIHTYNYAKNTLKDILKDRLTQELLNGNIIKNIQTSSYIYDKNRKSNRIFIWK